MKAWKEKQITRIRTQTAALRVREHVRDCDCCGYLLQTADMNADAPWAEFLVGVVRANVVRESGDVPGPPGHCG